MKMRERCIVYVDEEEVEKSHNKNMLGSESVCTYWTNVRKCLGLSYYTRNICRSRVCNMSISI
jgi:hypothetical protein